MSRQDIHNSDTPVICRSCEVRHRGLCGALDARQLLALSRHTHLVRRPAGEELIADASEVRTYANVMRGMVKLSKTLEDGRQQVVGLQFAPDFLGRIHSAQSKVAAQAASDVDLCTIPKAALEKLMAENPALERRLLEQTLRELDEARDWMVTLGRKTAEEKVASFLHRVALHIDPLASTAGESKSARFDLPLSRTDIADFLGLTIETVSRQLTRLRKDGVIEVEHNRAFFIPDLDRLEARCG